MKLLKMSYNNGEGFKPMNQNIGMAEEGGDKVHPAVY
jgi:hypothetical protein